MICAEAATALNNSVEAIGDSLSIAMTLKGLPSSFNSFKTVGTQKDKQSTFQQFNVSLLAYQESEHSNNKIDSVMKTDSKKPLSLHVRRKDTSPLNVNKRDGVTTAGRNNMILNFVERKLTLQR